ncbi:hypothetical protein [Pedobacter duraquae]|uniref:Uncharacterized protein n=1 Tax=Pedobacter duraquae TaxID=425511 RepID=A0A4R6IHV1_9SPHI|nr:hypothetical protein [Pedobacter duraquae]TDO21345.1 hypothetical protein CLV32_2450 [Pedobacter duraquae]
MKYIAFLICLFLLSCQNPTTLEISENKLIKKHYPIDTAEALLFSFERIFRDHENFPKYFGKEPLLIVKSKQIPNSPTIVFKGKKSKWVDQTVGITLENIKRPLPYIEIKRFETRNDSVLVDLMLTQLNRVYLIILKQHDENLKLASFEEMQL